MLFKAIAGPFSFLPSHRSSLVHLNARGVLLRNKQELATRKALERLKEMIDVFKVTALWESALKVPEWVGKPLWIHGDLSPGNLLIQNGRLSAVIDFGNLGIGDPACDLILVWNLFPASMRESFRKGIGVD